MIKVEISNRVWDEYPEADTWDIKDGCLIITKGSKWELQGQFLPTVVELEPAKTYKIYNKQEWLTVKFKDDS